MTAPLSPQDREQLETLFDRAAELPASEHADFVQRECGPHGALRDELSRLLAGLAWPDEAAAREVANLDGEEDGFVAITTVDSLPANPFGLHHVLGNVSEWCSNRPWQYGTEPGSDPSTRLLHSARGGNSRQGAMEARSAARLNGGADKMEPALGLRPARAIDCGLDELANASGLALVQNSELKTGTQSPRK